MVNEVNNDAQNPAGDEPLVSVLISVHNGESYLHETLNSVLAQDFAKFEVVIVNDGSTDRTADILAEYAVDQRFRIITQERRGLIYSLNLGLQLARAELIARLDADDIALPHRFTRQVEFMRAHPEVALLGSAIIVINKQGKELKKVVYPTGPGPAKLAMSRLCAVSHPSVMMRRTLVLGVGGYRSAFLHAEDYDLWLRISEHHPIDNLTEPLIRYRKHDKNVSLIFHQQQSLSTVVARHCSKKRIAGLPDPMEGKVTPVSLSDLSTLDLTEHEEALFHFESLKDALNTREHAFNPEFAKESLTRAWELQSHLSRGRLVRRCLIPGSAAFRRAGYRSESRVWGGRAFRIDPFNAILGLIRLLLRGW